MTCEEAEAMYLSEILARMDEERKQPRRRYPVVRTGPREPIPGIVRLSVYQRDGSNCRWCGATDRGLQLDHMLPWSAGGSDGSDNLRTLCTDCNQRRSNWYDHDHHPNLRPTTWWCWHCWRHPDLDGPPTEGHPEHEIDQQRVYRPPWRNGVNLNLAPYVTAETVQVYCAWCWGYGFTDRAFIEPQQAELSALVGDPLALHA